MPNFNPPPVGSAVVTNNPVGDSTVVPGLLSGFAASPPSAWIFVRSSGWRCRSVRPSRPQTALRHDRDAFVREDGREQRRQIHFGGSPGAGPGRRVRPSRRAGSRSVPSCDAPAPPWRPRLSAMRRADVDADADAAGLGAEVDVERRCRCRGGAAIVARFGLSRPRWRRDPFVTFALASFTCTCAEATSFCTSATRFWASAAPMRMPCMTPSIR
jgi:hypothetical protein